MKEQLNKIPHYMWVRLDPNGDYVRSESGKVLVFSPAAVAEGKVKGVKIPDQIKKSFLYKEGEKGDPRGVLYVYELPETEP